MKEMFSLHLQSKSALSKYSTALFPGPLSLGALPHCSVSGNETA